MRKFLTAACTFLMTAALLASSASAAIGDIKLEIKGVTTAPVQDGKVTQDEYGGNDPLVLDGSGKNTDGTWANTVWAEGEVIKYYYTWDADNLYVGITVEGDKTESQANGPKIGDGNVCPFGKCDSVQLGFNPGGMISGTHPLIYCVGFNADGQPFVHGDAYRSEKDGEQTVEISNLIKGYSKKYSADGLNYEVELVIPWDTMMVKGAGRSNEGAKVFDMTGEKAKIKDGYVLPIFCVYVDNDLAAGKNIYCRTDATTGSKWVAEEMGSVALVLRDAPKAEVTTTAPATADASSIALCALALSGLCAAVVIKKKSK